MDSQVCTNGACVCRPLLTDCGGGACVDLESDPANCGACGKTCSTGEVCLSSAIGMPGACTPVLPTSPCPANYTDCKAEGCVLTAAMKGNPIHCGGCNNVCAPNEICTTGATPSCVKYFASPSCTACPCTACGGDHRCCEMGGAALCVEGAVCGF